MMPDEKEKSKRIRKMSRGNGCKMAATDPDEASGCCLKIRQQLAFTCMILALNPIKLIRR